MGVNILLERGWTPDVLTKALVEGMRIVGIPISATASLRPRGVPCGELDEAGMAILKPLP